MKLTRYACLCLALCLAFSLCACGGGNTPPDGGHTHAGGTATCQSQALCEECGQPYGQTAAHTYENGSCTVCGAAEDTTPGGEDTPTAPQAWPNGAVVEAAGARLPEGSFALEEPTYDESTAEEVAANAFFRSTKKEAGKVYRAPAGTPVSISAAGDKEYDGGGAILIAPGGVVIENCHDITLKNLTVVGELKIVSGRNVLLEKVAVLSEGTALSVDAASNGVVARECRLSGKTAAAVAGKDNGLLYSCLFFTETGLADTGAQGTTLQHCLLEGSGTGVLGATAGAYRSNTLRLGEEDLGFALSAGTVNALVALNVIENAQSAILLSGVTNTAVVLNQAVSITAKGTHSSYICENSLGGLLTATDNTYRLADNNTVPADEYDHSVIQSGNENHNGNNLRDVNARPEVGADESLLPHVDKELFVRMERQETVKDLLDDMPRPVNQYLMKHAETDEIIILAPGVYGMTGERITFNVDRSNTQIYGYGAYIERQDSLDTLLYYTVAAGVEIKGLTLGYVPDSNAQAFILEKLGNNTVRTLISAGMVNEFGETDPVMFNPDVRTGFVQRAGTAFSFADIQYVAAKKAAPVEGIATIDITLQPSVYSMMKVGDLITTQPRGGGPSVIIRDSSADLVFRDVTLYGVSSGFAFSEGNSLSGTTYYRVYITPQAEKYIDEATYHTYRAIEKQYGISLEVRVDDEGNYRGAAPRFSADDATHPTSCAQGSQATFCVFENMTDDATNQNHMHARLHDAKDNGDGTTTLTYKGNLSQYSYEQGGRSAGSYCSEFREGDRVYVYTAAGQLVCDTAALTAAKQAGELMTEYNTNTKLFTVTVKTEDVNFEALAGYDLSLNVYDSDKKVLVDNMSLASNGFLFDNCKFQNIRSRGLLIKASEGTIKNCTFRNIGMACAALIYEIYWGESGVTEKTVIERNLMDNTGYYNNIDIYSPIAITGLGSSVDEDYLLYNNIRIVGNKVINRTTNYALYINSARDVQVYDNDFGPFMGNDFGKAPAAPETAASPKPVVHLNGAMNIEFKGNTFPDTGFLEDQIVCQRVKHIFGADVELDGVSLIPDKEN